MKKFMKTAGWQIGAFVLAIGAAFATNAMKDTTFFATVDGYLPMNSEATVCDFKIKCSNIPGPACQWKDASNEDHDLFELREEEPGVTKCVHPLYKI